MAYQISAHNGCCNAVKFSRSGEYFASGGVDNLVTTWNSNFYNEVNMGGIENVEEKYSEEYNTFKSNTRTKPKLRKRVKKRKNLTGIQGSKHNVEDLGKEIKPNCFTSKQKQESLKKEKS